MKSVDRIRELISGVIILTGSLIVLLFFTNLDVNNIYIKPEHSSTVWLIFSISSACYYVISRIKKTKEYWNPVFKLSLDLASLILFVGLLLSFLPGFIESSNFKSLILLSSSYFDTMLVFFILIYLVVGVRLIRGSLSR